jgi:hypothetical protein
MHKDKSLNKKSKSGLVKTKRSCITIKYFLTEWNIRNIKIK